MRDSSREQAILLAKNIRAVIFDFDGTFTDNRVLEGMTGPDGLLIRPNWRSHYDGQGVSFLRAIGIHVALVTNESGVSTAPAVTMVEKWNNLPSSRRAENSNGWEHIRLYNGMGGEKKVLAAEEFLKERCISWENTAAMGDDLVDLQLLRKSFFRATPISGEKAIKDMAHFVSVRAAGYGAVRDFANFILEARGIDPTTLPPQ